MSHPQAALVAAPAKPTLKPERPEFSSGPCAKRPGWTAEAVAARAFLGRSHRAAKPKAQLKDAIDRTARLLGVPEGYRVGIVPASDTGAFEMAMWSMLGARPVDMLVWESFGQGWATDATKQLKLDGLPGADRAPMARCRTSARCARTPTSASPGTAPPQARGCRTATGSPTTARG